MNKRAMRLGILVTTFGIGVAACNSTPPESSKATPPASGSSSGPGGSAPGSAPASSSACLQNAQATISGIPSTVSPGQHVRFRARVVNNGDTWWYHGAYFQLAQTTALTVIPPAAGYSPSLRPGGIQELTFDLASPTTPGTHTLTMQNVVRKGADQKLANGKVCAPASSADVYFGQPASVTFTVEATRR